MPTHYHTFVVIKTRVYTNSRTFFIMQARMIARNPPRLLQPLTKISLLFKLPRRPQAMEKNSSLLNHPSRPRALEMNSSRLKHPRHPSLVQKNIPSWPTTEQREMLLTTTWTRNSQPNKNI